VQTTGGERNAESQVWQLMLGIHGDIFGRLNRTLTREFGITLAKFDVLAQLYRVGDRLTQSDLSRQRKVTDGNITGLVHRLIAAGLISREVSASDRRAYAVQLTDQGRAVYRAARDRHDELLATFFGSLGPTRLTEVRSVLGQLSHALAQAPARASE